MLLVISTSKKFCNFVLNYALLKINCNKNPNLNLN